MKKVATRIKVDKKLDNLPDSPIFTKKFENAKAFLSTLKIVEDKQTPIKSKLS